MSILGRKLTGHFLGGIFPDMKDGFRNRRIPGARIKHLKWNRLKMCDKARSLGFILSEGGH
jgi:hypothetical protein